MCATPKNGGLVSFCIRGRSLVLLPDIILIGHVDNPTVHIALRSPVRELQAILIRHERRYRLIPFWDKDGRVHRVKIGKIAKAPLDGGGAFLEDMQEVLLEDSGCIWTFRLPVPGSSSAILSASPNKFRAVARDGSEFRQIVLMDQDCVVGPELESHVRIPELPGSFSIRKSGAELLVNGHDTELSGGVLVEKSIHKALLMPGQLMVHPAPPTNAMSILMDIYQGRGGRNPAVLHFENAFS